MKRLLLDTQAFIWWDMNDPRLGGRARALIREAAEVYVSAASAWEISIKVSLGKLTTTRLTSRALMENGFRELSVSIEHAEALGALPMVHRDPFDRILVATAIIESLPIVTSDTQLAAYAVTVVDATA